MTYSVIVLSVSLRSRAFSRIFDDLFFEFWLRLFFDYLFPSVHWSWSMAPFPWHRIRGKAHLRRPVGPRENQFHSDHPFCTQNALQTTAAVIPIMVEIWPSNKHHFSKIHTVTWVFFILKICTFWLQMAYFPAFLARELCWKDTIFMGQSSRPDEFLG